MLNAPKREARRIRLWLQARNAYEDEQAKEQQQKVKETEEKARGAQNNRH